MILFLSCVLSFLVFCSPRQKRPIFYIHYRQGGKQTAHAVLCSPQCTLLVDQLVQFLTSSLDVFEAGRFSCLLANEMYSFVIYFYFRLPLKNTASDVSCLYSVYRPNPAGSTAPTVTRPTVFPRMEPSSCIKSCAVHQMILSLCYGHQGPVGRATPYAHTALAIHLSET